MPNKPITEDEATTEVEAAIALVFNKYFTSDEQEQATQGEIENLNEATSSIVKTIMSMATRYNEQKEPNNFDYHPRANYIDCKRAGTDYCSACGWTDSSHSKK